MKKILINCFINNRIKQIKSLKLIFPILFLSQLLSFMGIVGLLSFLNGQKAVNDISEKLLSETGYRVRERLKAYTSSVILTNQFYAKTIQNEKFSEEKLQKLLNHFSTQIVNLPHVSGIYWGDNLGAFYGAIITSDKSLIVGTSNQKNNYREPFFEYFKKTCNQVVPRVFDSRTRDWYQIAQEEKKPTWSKIYNSYGEDVKILTHSHPIYNQEEKLKGVLGIDIFIYRIDEFLRNLKIGKNGQVFLVSRSGRVIASSAPDGITKKKTCPNESHLKLNSYLISKEQKTKIKNYKRVSQTTVNFLRKKFADDLNIIDIQQTLYFYINKEKYFLRITPFKEQGGLDWLIVVVVPESDFMEQIHANTRNTIALCILALIVAVIIGILTTRWITRPILKINSVAKSLASGNWGEKIRLNRKDELGQLAKSFNTMASQLQESFTALEETNRTLE